MTTRLQYAAAGMLLWGLGLNAGHAQTLPSATPAPLVQTDFEASDGGWTAMGPNAKAAVTHEANSVHGGKGALTFAYTVAKGQFGALVLPTPDGKLAHAGSFQFWVKADHATPIAVLLSEKAGGHYTAFFTVPAGQWQSVSLTPADFTLGEDKNDPKDPDNKLDLDQVESVSLVDLGQMFAQTADTPLADVLGVQTGARTLLLDDFTVTAASETAPPKPTTTGGVSLDAFTGPQLGWIALGGAMLSREPATAAGGPAMTMTYKQAPGKIAGVLKNVPRGSLAGKSKIAFSLTTAKSAAIVVHLEERGGGKYDALVPVKADPKGQALSLATTDFEASNESHDANGRLDMDQVTQIGIMDMSGLMGAPNPDSTDGAQDNTLHIGPITAM